MTEQEQVEVDLVEVNERAYELHEEVVAGVHGEAGEPEREHAESTLGILEATAQLLAEQLDWLNEPVPF